MEFKDPNRVEVVHPNVLLYGLPGSGKTTGATSAPGRKLVLNFDLDNATHFARSRGVELMEPEFDYKTLPTLLQEVAIESKKDEPPWDVVIIDPVGDMHRQLLEQASNYAVRPSINAYGDVATDVERFCRAICKAPNVSCIIVCHDEPMKDEDSGVVLRSPYTGTSNPKIGRKLMGMADIVAYTGVVVPDGGDVQYVAQLVSANGRTGKDRFGVLGKHRPLDLAEWFAVINENGSDEPTATPDEPAEGEGK